MRITSGVNKGKVLRSVGGKEIRPTLARVRKSFFDIIGERIFGANVLDLFAGAGTLGIEALSRGAEGVVFLDNSNVSLKVISRNLTDCGFETRARLLRIEIPRDLEKVKGRYDIIFIDPPYDTELAHLTLEKLKTCASLFSSGAMIFVQISKREGLLDRYGDIRIRDIREYGDTKLYLYEFNGNI